MIHFEVSLINDLVSKQKCLKVPITVKKYANQNLPKKPKLTFRHLQNTDLAKIAQPVEPKMIHDSARFFLNSEALKEEEASKMEKLATFKAARPSYCKPRSVFTSQSRLRSVDNFEPFAEPVEDEKETLTSRLKSRFHEKLSHIQKSHKIRDSSTSSQKNRFFTSRHVKRKSVPMVGKTQ